MRSIWTENIELPKFESLQQDIKTDVLIIGGGMAGMLCAWKLKEAGVDCLLVEAERIGNGITKNTTAKITSEHGAIFDKMLKRFGLEKTQKYLEANEKAIEQYRLLCRQIDCDFESKDSFVYSKDNRAKLEREATALEKIGFPALFKDQLPLPFPVVGAIGFRNQAQFHPLLFLAGIAKGLKIFENTKVRELIGTDAVTDAGKIHAQKIIVATHFPFINKHGSYYLKMYQHRSYVIALDQAPDVGGMYVDESQKGMSFRNAQNMLLLGGGGHRTGKMGGGFKELEAFSHSHYPDSIIKAHFATQDCMTLDKIPYIGKYSSRTENLYVATGFNKWGMTSSMVSAMILPDLVQGRKNLYEDVFSPSRTIVRPQLAVNGFGAVINLLTPTTKRCPHLGCALKWNQQEHSWDCPCHGSRFTEEGKLIDNPATGDLKKIPGRG